MIERSIISEQIAQYLIDVNENEQNILRSLDEEVIENEMKRRAITNIQFDESVKRFISSGVLILLNAIFNDDVEVVDKYPF